MYENLFWQGPSCVYYLKHLPVQAPTFEVQFRHKEKRNSMKNGKEILIKNYNNMKNDK